MDKMAHILQCYVNRTMSAPTRGLEFNMSVNAFIRIKQQTHCAYSGIEFTEVSKNGGYQPYAQTLERIDNTKGYVDGNVIPVCYLYNNVRKTYTSETIDKGIRQVESDIRDREMLIEKLDAYLKAYSIVGVKTGGVEVKQKPHISNKSYDWWIKQHNHRDGNIRTAKKYNGLMNDVITRAAKKGIDGVPKKQRKVFAQWSKSLDIAKNQIKMTEARLNAFYEKHGKVGMYSSAHDQVDEATIARTVTEKENAVKELNTLIERKGVLIELKPVLKKFENLSDTEKALLVEGLPLSTSKVKFLRHKIGKALTQEA